MKKRPPKDKDEFETRNLLPSIKTRILLLLLCNLPNLLSSKFHPILHILYRPFQDFRFYHIEKDIESVIEEHTFAVVTEVVIEEHRPVAAAEGHRPVAAAEGHRPVAAAEEHRPVAAAEEHRPEAAAEEHRPVAFVAAVAVLALC